MRDADCNQEPGTACVRSKTRVEALDNNVRSRSLCSLQRRTVQRQKVSGEKGEGGDKLPAGGRIGYNHTEHGLSTRPTDRR